MSYQFTRPYQTVFPIAATVVNVCGVHDGTNSSLLQETLHFSGDLAMFLYYSTFTQN